MHETRDEQAARPPETQACPKDSASECGRKLKMQVTHTQQEERTSIVEGSTADAAGTATLWARVARRDISTFNS